MSPSQLQNNANQDVQNHGYWSSPLKINKASHIIKKSYSSSPSSSSSSSSLANILPKPPLTPPPSQQQRQQPVIIYTHAPKIIRTSPRDFMALVQRLTGLSGSRGDIEETQTDQPENAGHPSSPPPQPPDQEIDQRTSNIVAINDDKESSSVTTGSCCNNVGDGLGNSCLISQQNPCDLLPVVMSKSADFLCPTQPFCNYSDSIRFAGASMRTPVPSSSSNEFRDY